MTAEMQPTDSAQALTLPRGSHEVKMQRMKVTPDLAAEWLGYNTHNRNIRPGIKTAYANAMRDGEWRMDVDPICFAGVLGGRGKNAPVLLNGQHRLSAIIEADATIELLVLEGLSIKDQTEMDTGVKRQLSDQLRLQGFQYSADLAAVLRLVYAYEHGILKAKHWATNATLLRFLEQHPELPESVVAGAKLNNAVGGRRSVMGAAHYIISQLEDPAVEEDLDEFWDKVAEGDNLPANSPILLYRKTLQSQTTAKSSRRRMDQTTQLALLFKTWNAWRTGDTMHTLAWRGGGKNPEIFPQPE
jgi:hypothetical protein